MKSGIRQSYHTLCSPFSFINSHVHCANAILRCVCVELRCLALFCTISIRGEQNGTESWNMWFRESACANNKCTMLGDTMQLPHGRINWNRFVYIYKMILVVGVNRAGGWKGLVSYGLGADISLPPCLIGGRHRVGGRLVSDTKLTV